MKSTVLIALGVFASASSLALAQDRPMQMANSDNLPEECRSAPPASSKQSDDMMGQMQQKMQSMTDQMTDTQKGLQEAMIKMGPAMMQGMMAKDPDLAWACAMIPHHQAALDMSRTLLKGGNNTEAKKMAEKTIRDQEKDIADLKQWISKNAKKEAK